MGQASNACGALRRAPLVVAVSLSLAASSAATAAELKSVDGVLQFANVQVINAPQAASTAAAPQGGMRAYRDSATSELRGPSAEEAAAVSRSPATNGRRASASEASSEVPTFAAAGGGVGAVLDESFMQYSVVTRQADGSLAEVCVTGTDEAARVVTKQPVVQNARKEILNDR